MADAIGPGDWVEFVGPRKHSESPTIGSVWLCTGFTPGCVDRVCKACGSFEGLILQGLPRIPYGWCPARFRPIYRPKASILQSLLTPAPKERQDA